ncbi:hypothetical protein CANTEDRAFT_112074 [Yamadazyma tenuis ATCC 10573]|uniref:K Homology domain-containing protein n=2 Tax=Candida tenuis TaxID=2315449 RepID=G3AXA6_CANTC|nr:uncharacterized protein CANTEDRAFT_112074 [Yamadazyma tenuis ATCC 10573]EGV66326.1 hypothetical protein CANTEDRAFT_112074 [Yamadazyma tenuis ATCC 10573]
MEISKDHYGQFMGSGIVKEEDVRLIPTGHKGFLVHISISPNNLERLISVLTATSNHYVIKSHSIDYESLPASSGDFSPEEYNTRCEHHKQTTDVHTEKYIELRKNEVAFLLGRNGERINSIREQTGCFISISAIPKQADLLCNRKVIQTLKLAGTPGKIDSALKMIQSNLSIYRENDSKFL